MQPPVVSTERRRAPMPVLPTLAVLFLVSGVLLIADSWWARAAAALLFLLVPGLVVWSILPTTIPEHPLRFGDARTQESPAWALDLEQRVARIEERQVEGGQVLNDQIARLERRLETVEARVDEAPTSRRRQ